MPRLSITNTRLKKTSSTESLKHASNLVKTPSEKSKTEFLQPQNHPELEDLCIINELNMERGYPNGEVMNIDVSFRGRGIDLNIRMVIVT